MHSVPRAGVSRLILALALVLALVSERAASAEGEAPLSYRFVETPGGVGAHLLRADLQKVELRMLYAQDMGAGALTARQFLDRTGATAVFNGPFFDLDGSPMGLLVVDGVERVALRPVDWGVFSLTDSGPSIVHTRDWKSDRQVDAAFQVGPRLVVDGEVLSLKSQSARRTALCVLPDGRIEVLVSPGSIRSDDLAGFFAAEGCSDALNLDGGTSSQLYLRRAGIVVDEPGGVAVPVAVGLFVAAQEAQIEPRRGCAAFRSCS
ncbi:MAG: hypothetical protein CMP23_00115 [Rickettsiales bacterium]|nr:hypothetical protein [Rickettsiales bacterium]